MALREKNNQKEACAMQEKNSEKKPIPWEVADPKLPVVRSGHLENRSQH